MKNPKGAIPILGILVLVLAAGAPSGFAELIQGTIISLNEQAKTLNLQRMDASTGQLEEFEIIVQEDAEFEGATSLGELKKGDQVVVDVSPGETPDVLEAHSVELIQA